VLLQFRAVLVGDVDKFDANTEAGSAAGYDSIEPQFRFLDPQPDLEFLPLLEGNGHLDEAPAQAKIGGLSPDESASVGVQFHRSCTSQAGMLAAIRGWPIVVGLGGGQGKVPKPLFWRDVQQANVILASSCRFPNPLDTEMYLGCSVGHADNFIDGRFGLQTAQLDTLLANVDGKDLFGKDLPGAIGPKDPDRHLDFFSRLAAHPHVGLLLLRALAERARESISRAYNMLGLTVR
jgi:hypothetical protein